MGLAGSIDVASPTLEVIKKRLAKADAGQTWRDVFAKVAAVAVILGLVFTFLFGFYVVPDNGMDPALKEGDLVLYYRLASDVTSDDVVVYEADGAEHVGRVAALPGESVEIRQDGTFLVNGNPQAVEYGRMVTPAEGGVTYPVLMNLSSYFVLGDNVEYAWDSRTCGAVDRSQVRGKALSILRLRNV